MRYIIALLLTLCIGVSVAASTDPWVLVGKSDRSSFYMYRGSLDVGTDARGARIFYVGGKYTVDATKESVLQIWYVPVQHCLVGKGIFYAAQLDGTPVTDVEFKIGEDTIAASLAKIICTAALDKLTNSNNRI